MKMKYKTPLIENETLCVVDVITASSAVVLKQNRDVQTDNHYSLFGSIDTQNQNDW